MACLIQVLLRIVKGTHAEQMVHRVHKQSVSVLIRQSHETYICLIARLLRIEEFGELITDGTIIQSYVITCFSVAVAVRLASAVPGHILQASVQLDPIAHSQEFSHACRRDKRALHEHIPGGIYRISQAVSGVRTARKTSVHRHINHLVRRCHLDILHNSIIVCLLPVCVH